MSDECECANCSADDLLIPQINKNTGHGHVNPRPDGLVARCGGPRLCSECIREAALKHDALPPMQEQCPCACCVTTSVNFHPITSPPLVPALPAARRTVIGFTGLAGSGKSECAHHLIAHHGFVRGKCAGALKEMMRALLRYRGADAATIERMVEGDLKETLSPLLNGRTPRHGMQTLGTEWGRDCIDVNLWVDTEMDARAAAPALVFDDVRFPNEAAAIRAAGGLIVSIKRPGAGAGAAGHSSENGVGAVDLTIVNNHSIGHLRERVDGLVRDMSWIDLE